MAYFPPKSRNRLPDFYMVSYTQPTDHRRSFGHYLANQILPASYLTEYLSIMPDGVETWKTLLAYCEEYGRATCDIEVCGRFAAPGNYPIFTGGTCLNCAVNHQTFRRAARSRDRLSHVLMTSPRSFVSSSASDSTSSSRASASVPYDPTPHTSCTPFG